MNNKITEFPEHKLASEQLEDKFDVINIVFQLWKGKVIILLTMVLAVLIASINLYVTPAKWSSNAILTQPTIGQVTAYNAVQNVLYAQFPQDKPPVDILQDQLFKLFTNFLSTYTMAGVRIEPLAKDSIYPISIKVTDKDGTQAQQVLLDAIRFANEQVVKKYTTDFQSSLKQRQQVLQASLDAQVEVAKTKKAERLEVQKHALKIAEASNIEQTQLRQADNLSDDTLYLLGTTSLKAMIANETSKALEFDDNYYAMQSELLTLQKISVKADELQAFSYIQQPKLPAQPDSQKKNLVMVLAVLLGLLLGSVIVLVRNTINSYRAML